MIYLREIGVKRNIPEERLAWSDISVKRDQREEIIINMKRD